MLLFLSGCKRFYVAAWQAPFGEVGDVLPLLVWRALTLEVKVLAWGFA